MVCANGLDRVGVFVRTSFPAILIVENHGNDLVPWVTGTTGSIDGALILFTASAYIGQMSLCSLGWHGLGVRCHRKPDDVCR